MSLDIKEKMQPSAQLASELVENYLKVSNLKAGERYGLLINGLGKHLLWNNTYLQMMCLNYSMKRC